jgi:hypothetical protein
MKFKKDTSSSELKKLMRGGGYDKIKKTAKRKKSRKK